MPPKPWSRASQPASQPRGTALLFLTALPALAVRSPPFFRFLTKSLKLKTTCCTELVFGRLGSRQRPLWGSSFVHVAPVHSIDNSFFVFGLFWSVQFYFGNDLIPLAKHYYTLLAKL
jgi:hypothetical protein